MKGTVHQISRNVFFSSKSAFIQLIMMSNKEEGRVIYSYYVELNHDYDGLKG
jgi:hypothetical protein